jgi:hypothetical protein
MRIDPMKRLLMLSLLVSSIAVYADDKHEECNADDSVTAQASALLKVAEKLEADGCTKRPAVSDFKAICSDISARTKAPANESESYEFYYEKRIWELSCANPGTDDEKTANAKINKMWNKYKKDFKCDTLDFALSNGNILKFSLSQKMPEVIETLAGTYGLDINFVDPKDNMNVLDYVNNEIKKLSQLPNNE